MHADGAAGLELSGAHGSVVRDNVFEGHVSAVGEASVVVTDDAKTGAVATGNVVTGNEFHNNTLDLASYSVGDNRISRNDCSTSIPERLCR